MMRQAEAAELMEEEGMNLAWAYRVGDALGERW